MRIFVKDCKTNFVDESDCYVGWSDQYSSCCEVPGYFFLGDEPTEGTIRDLEDVGHDVPQEELGSFYFDRHFFKEWGDYDGGGYAVFRLVHRRLENDRTMRERERGRLPQTSLYLVLYNHHNGYYSHGFEFGLVGGEVIQESHL